VKGNTRGPPPVVRSFPLTAQFWERLCHLIGERMISEKVPPHGSDQHPGDGQRNLAILPYKPKATFHWPPDCLWPFMDHGPENET
jgi:hypothetical protein